MQREEWQKYSRTLTFDSIRNSLRNPAPFQSDMADLVDEVVAKFHYTTVAEIGCEKAITLMLLRNAKRRIFVDYNAEMLRKVQVVVESSGIDAQFHCIDMFRMPEIPSGSIDLVFNSGVIEHYTREERIRLFVEYHRVVAAGGRIIIAYPNHYSILYKTAYVSRRALGRRFWPWPKEYRIRDLSHEMRAAGFSHEGTQLLDAKTTASFYGRLPIINALASYLATALRSEKYLRVCTGLKG